ncbi:MAG: DUF2283 domain-containing protein [Candidatus Hydrothermarchaeales archaeon]
MEKRLKFSFDKEGDVLDISIGTPEPALSEDIGDDILIRRNQKKEVVGFTILNFTKRFEKLGKEETMPIKANFVLVED